MVEFIGESEIRLELSKAGPDVFGGEGSRAVSLTLFCFGDGGFRGRRDLFDQWGDSEVVATPADPWFCTEYLGPLGSTARRAFSSSVLS